MHKEKKNGKGKKHIISIGHITRLAYRHSSANAHAKAFLEKADSTGFFTHKIDLGVFRYIYRLELWGCGRVVGYECISLKGAEPKRIHR
jgi:hypothetical protein